MTRRLSILCNPTSGSGRALAAAREVMHHLQGHPGLEVNVAESESPEHMRRLARRAEQHDDAVAVAGGDGTVLQAVNGLERFDKPLAVVPAGTANVLARELKIGLTPRRAAEAILRWSPRPMDVLDVNGRPALLMVGVGLDAAVVRSIHRQRTDGDLSMTSYILPTLKELFGWSTRPVEVVLDGRTIARRADHVLMTNTRQYGGPFSIASGARHDDGLIDVVVTRCENRPCLLATMFGVMAGLQRRMPQVRFYRGRHVTVRADEPLPVQTDGDPAGTTPVELDIHPRRLLLLR